MTSQSPCLEVAVYTVKDAHPFGGLQQQAHHNLASLAGFISSVALCGLDNRASRADLVLWESEDTAKGAAEVIKIDDRFTDFMQGIDSIRHFAHYKDASPGALHRLAESPIIEIAAFEVPATGGIAELRQQVSQALQDVEGASPQIAGIHIDSPLSLIDLIGWNTKAAHEAAPGLLMERHPEFEAFFSGMEKISVFELFEVAR